MEELRETTRLSEKEQQRLINALRSELSKRASMGGSVDFQAQNGGDIRVYDFREPDKFSKSQFATLGILFENFAREATTYLTTATNSSCDIEVMRVDQRPYQDVIKSMSQPTIISIFEMLPLEGQALLEISPEMGFELLEKVFGGVSTEQRIRNLTDMEKSVMGRLSERLLELFESAWETISKVDVDFKKIETNPQFVQIAPSMEICAVATMSVRIGGNKNGFMVIVLPYILLEPIMSSLTSHMWFAPVGKTNNARNKQLARENIEQSNLLVRVEAGKATVPLSLVEELEAGDLVILDKKKVDPFDVYVEGELKFHSQVFRKYGKIVAKLSHEIIEEDRSELRDEPGESEKDS